MVGGPSTQAISDFLGEAEEIIENIAGQYNPMEAIKGLKIVL